MSDVSRETGMEEHARSPQHQVIEQEKPQQVYDPRTKTVRPIVIEYRACGCITKREGE